MGQGRKVAELEEKMAEIGTQLLEARTAALSPEFVEKQERRLAGAFESSRYDHLELSRIEDLLKDARSLRREKIAGYETTLVVDVKIAELKAAQEKKLQEVRG